MNRSLAYWLVAAFLSAAVIEGGCLLLFTAASGRLGLRASGDRAVSKEQLRGLERVFHPELGWLPPQGTPFGERRRPRRFDNPVLSAYGDSFTYCDEVEDHEAWGAVLARRLEGDVYNFGVGAYGPDQALLRYRLQKDRPRTPLVMLGFTTENLGRILSRYRKFYVPKTGTPLTKPRFELREGRLTLLPNPLRRAEDLSFLADPRFIESLGEHDAWHELDGPRLAFPYSRLLVHPSLWRKAGLRLRGIGVEEARDRALWDQSEPRRLLFSILDAFVAEVRAERQRPLLMLLPMRYRSSEPHPAEREFLAYCDSRAVPCIDGIGALASAAPEPASRERLFAPKGHLSAEGNRLLAGEIERVLRRERLLPASAGSR